MPRTQLSRSTAGGAFPTLPLAANAASLDFDPADQPNGNYYRCSGRELLLMKNTGATPRNITITALEAPAATITNYSLGAGLFAAFGPFPARGWRQPTGWVHVDAAHAEVQIAVLELPAIS